MYKSQMDNENIEAILNKISEKELKTFLCDLINRDENMYDLFRRKFSDYFPKISPVDYKRKIYTAIREAGGKDGFIDYSEGWNYVSRMYEFTNEAKDFVEKGDYETAFAIVKIILDSIPDTAIDGSNGETSDVANSCIDVITDILDEASEDDTILKDILDYILKELKTHNLSNYGIDLEDLIVNFIRDGLFLEKCEKALIDVIRECDADKWYSYHKRYYLEYLLELYDRTNDNQKRIYLIKNNLDILEIFQKYALILMAELDIKEVVSELIKYREIYPKHQEYISNTLLDIYKKNKMFSEYKEELYLAFFEYDKYNFEKYIEIKKLYDKKEWIKEVENIISRIVKSSNVLSKIYIEEKMIDRLYDLVKNDRYINSYEEYLLPKYRNELIEKNIEFCKNDLRFANNRRDYREIASKLKHIKKLDIDSKYINAFLESIRSEYANKPALMEEISFV